MYLRNLITATTLAAAATAFAADSNFDRTLNVSGSPNVSVSTGSGYIHLNPGSGNQVHIVAHLRSSHGCRRRVIQLHGDGARCLQQHSDGVPRNCALHEQRRHGHVAGQQYADQRRWDL